MLFSVFSGVSGSVLTGYGEVTVRVRDVFPHFNALICALSARVCQSYSQGEPVLFPTPDSIVRFSSVILRNFGPAEFLRGSAATEAR
jgi:hypothetical protein